VQIGNTDWNTTFSDPKRKEYHEKKMASKDSRPAAHLHALGINAGTVRHIDLSN